MWMMDGTDDVVGAGLGGMWAMARREFFDFY